MSRPGISVVVPTRDRLEFLEGCLASLRSTLGPHDELIVVDSASRDDRVRELVTSAGATYLRCARPGASIARNAGWRVARHDLVAFIDDDVRVDPCWADALAESFTHAPAVTFVTGRIGLTQEQAATERPVAFKDDREPARLDRNARGSLGHGANLAVRRGALEALGGFDEALGAGGPLCGAEDYDLFDRLFAAGMVGRYEPAVSSVHLQWRNRRALLGLEWRYGIGLGARLSKLLRSDRERARAAARELFWETGLRAIVRDLRERYEFGALFALFRTAGALVGVARGFIRPLRGGHFQARRRTPVAKDPNVREG